MLRILCNLITGLKKHCINMDLKKKKEKRTHKELITGRDNRNGLFFPWMFEIKRDSKWIKSTTCHSLINKLQLLENCCPVNGIKHLRVCSYRNIISFCVTKAAPLHNTTLLLILFTTCPVMCYSLLIKSL